MIFSAPRFRGDARAARVVIYAVAAAIFCLSLQDDSDIELAVTQSSHTLVAKITKDPRHNHGGGGEIAVAAASAPRPPSFEPSFLVVGHRQYLPTLYLFDSIAARAPPVYSAV